LQAITTREAPILSLTLERPSSPILSTFTPISFVPKTALNSVDSIFWRGKCAVSYNDQTGKVSISPRPHTSSKPQSDDPTARSYSRIPTAKLL
jgi:hypothetical protein